MVLGGSESLWYEGGVMPQCLADIAETVEEDSDSEPEGASSDLDYSCGVG